MDWDHNHSDQEDFQNDAREPAKITEYGTLIGLEHG